MNEKDSWTYKDIFFSKNQREELKYTSLLHDIGKVWIPESILDKENKLSNEKMEMIRMRFYMIKYPLITEWSDSSWLDEVLQFIEKINKSNYSSPEDIERLNSIALKTYISHDWKEKPYLEKEELYFLSIWKGNLTKEERRAIEKHVKDTLAILSHIEFTEDLKNISRFAADHHEKIDWMWYPHGKKGDEITLEWKIIAIADIFEALTAKDRPYKNPMPAEMAMNTLLLEANDWKLDLDIVKFFISEGLWDIEY
jgi:response regulator RpfG family c-di-GMP phosphodiesterase